MQNEEWNICPFSIDDDFVHCCVYHILHYNHWCGWLLKMAPSLSLGHLGHHRNVAKQKDEGLSKCLK